MTYLDNALRNADEAALEARQIILGMRSQHANMVVTLDAVRDSINDADWGDFQDVIAYLDLAQIELSKVYATKDQTK